MAANDSRRNGGRGAGAANRAALLASARHLFDTRGLDVPLSAIAQHAGVGQGSLYRHFPDRHSLAVAVFEENVREVEQLGATPGSTLTDLLRLLTGHAIRSAAFVQLVLSGPRNPELAGLAARVRAVVLALPASGDITWGHDVRTDHADDILLAIGMVASATATAPAAERSDVARRAWALLGVSL